MTISRLREFGATALRASSIAGFWAIVFAGLFFLVMFVAILGLVPGLADLPGATLKLIGVESSGKLDAVTVFWALVVYLGIFAVQCGRSASAGDAKSGAHHVLFGSLAVLAFCAGIVFLLEQREVEASRESAKEMALGFVRRNEAIMKQFGPEAHVTIQSYAIMRDGSVSYYDVAVWELPPKGDIRAISAIVHVSPDRQVTLLCTRPRGNREANKHPCEQ